MRQNSQHPHSAPYRRTVSKVALDDAIKNMSVFPVGKKPTGEYIFITLDVSLRALVKDNMEEFENNFFKHTFGHSSYLDATEGLHERMREYFTNDKLGLKRIPYTDGNCWKVVTVPVDPRLVAATAKKAKKAKKGKKGKKGKRGKKAKKANKAKKAKKGKKGKGGKKKKAKDTESEAEGSGAESEAEGSEAAQSGSASEGEVAKSGSSSEGEVAKSEDSSSSGDEAAAKKSSQKKPVKTTFYTDLQQLQKRYYLHLRASIVKYMDEPAKNFYNTVMAQEDAKRDLSRADKYAPGKRISWKWIKKMIYTKMCRRTNGSYFYRPLMTLYRKDKQTRHTWCDLVKGIQQDIEAFKKGYNKIGSRDAVEKLWDWLDKEEQKVLREWFKRSHKPRYEDTQTILMKVNLYKLIDIINTEVPTSEWPKESYSNVGCKHGRAKLLYEHAYVKKLKDELAAAKRNANNRNQHTHKRNKRKREKGNQQSNKDKPESDDDPVMDFETEDTLFADFAPIGGSGENKKNKKKRKKRRKGKKGGAERRTYSKKEKDNIPPCESCLSLGLGIMRHKVCDKVKQRKTLEARAKKMDESDTHDDGYYLAMTYKARRKSRQKEDLDYPAGSCKWCIAWGNDPERARHAESVCIHRPDGEMQKKLKCTYQKMVSSTKAQDLFKARKEVFKDRREAKKADKKKVSFSGASERLPSTDVCERVPNNDRLRDITVSERVPNVEAEASVPEEDQEGTDADGEMEMDAPDQDLFTGLGDTDVEDNQSSGPPARKRQKKKKTRDPRDPTFYEIHFAALKAFKTFEKTNTRFHLTALRRYLFNNDSVRKVNNKNASRAPKARREKIKSYNWVQLPLHYESLPHQEYNPLAAVPSDSDSEKEGDGTPGTNKFLSRARAETDSGYPEDKDNLTLEGNIVVDKIVQALEGSQVLALPKAKAYGARRKRTEAERLQAARDELVCERLANGTLAKYAMNTLDIIVNRTDLNIKAVENYRGLLTEYPKPNEVYRDLVWADRNIVDKYNDVHLGVFQLTLKAIVKGRLNAGELAHLKKCRIGNYVNQRHLGVLTDTEYARLVVERTNQIANGTCPVAKYRRRKKQLDSQATAARKRQRLLDDENDFRLAMGSLPDLGPDGKPIPAKERPPSHKEVLAGALVRLESEPDSDSPEGHAGAPAGEAPSAAPTRSEPPAKQSTDKQSDSDVSNNEEGGNAGTKKNAPDADQVTSSRCSLPCQPVCVPNETYTHTPSTGGEEELGFDSSRKKLRLRSKGSMYSVIEIPTEAYIPAVKHARTSLPVARTISVNANLKQDSTQSNQPHLSEEKGFRLLQAYMTYKDPQGRLKVGRVQLDTQSAVSYAIPEVTVPRNWRPWESRYAIGIKREKIKLKQPTSFTVMRKGQQVVIDTNDPHKILGGGCVALLSLEAIQKLGIDLNYHARFTSHKPIKFLDSLSETMEQNDKALRELLEEYAQPLSAKDMCRVSALSERVIQEYLETHGDEYKKEPIPLETSLDINPEMSDKDRKELMQIVLKYKHVFARSTNTLPPPMSKVKPHKFKLKPGAKPVQCPCPKFGPAKRKLILDWVRWAEEAGLIEPAEGAEYASRLHLAAKRGANTPKSQPPDGIRITWAGVEVNDTLEKSVPTYTNAWEQIYKVANFKYKFTADGLKQYWSIPLDKESRNVTAFWTPLGLYRFKRLVMGTKNAATIAQNAYTWAMNNLLPAEALDQVANFADDFMGGADSHVSLNVLFEQFLDMASKANITINPKKVRIGYSDEQFYGYRINNGRITPADRNLDPVRNMEDPKNRSELRSVMGVFNQFKCFIKDYGKAGSPAAIVNELASVKVPYIWTDRHSKALQALKDTVLVDGIWVYAPLNDRPLHLETDGSEDGWGAVLFQIVDGERHVIKMWSKRWPTEA